MMAIAVVVVALLIMPAGASSADQNSKELAGVQREAAARELVARADSAGALGVYFDTVNDEYAVVLSSTLARATTSQFNDLGLGVRMETLDVDAGMIDRVTSALTALHRKVPSSRYSFALDLRTGFVDVTSEAPRETFADVEAAFPGRIAFTPGVIESTAEGSWSNDIPPHWGGAWIQPNSGQPGLLCTSGWAMKTASGVRRMVTAGHCFPNGAGTNMGTAGRGSDAYPGIDVARVSGKTYQGYIYADGANGERRVNDGNNPVLGSSYCITGRSSGFKCGFVAQQSGITACYNPEGCTYNLYGARTSDNRVFQKGDSGGPFFIKGGSLTVGIRGINVARQSDIFGNWTSLVQGYHTIADFYVSTIVTN
jgi:hypothetical protein